MRVLALNVRGGSAEACAAVTRRLEEHNVDVLLLTEVASPKPLLGALRSAYPHQHVSEATAKARGAAVLSRLPLIPEVLTALALRRRCAVATVGGTTFLALYGPASWRDFEDLNTFWRSTFDYLGQAAARPTVVGGDFNLGLAVHDKEIGRTSAWTKCADPFYRGFVELGYVDAWRSVNGTTREYSYYPPKRGPKHTPHGRRLDHIFVSPSLRSVIASCYYDHSFREATPGRGILDHSGLILQMQLVA